MGLGPAKQPIMTRQEHLLTILMEECAEVAQRASKALRFGMNETQPGQPLSNADRIVYEFNDLLAVMALLVKDGAFGDKADALDQEAIEKKWAKIEKYLEYSANCGTLESAEV